MVGFGVYEIPWGEHGVEGVASLTMRKQMK